MHIGDLRGDDEGAIEAAAQVLFDAFRPVEWLKDHDDARARVRRSLAGGETSLIACDESGEVVGWVAGYREYARVWELNPLAVAPAWQRQGVGRALVAALEERAASLGGITLRLGTDDMHLVATGAGRTSLGDVDLYPDPLKHLSEIRNLGGHPYEFYLACGYSLVGVMPDANGFGQPDIFMAKRIGVR